MIVLYYAMFISIVANLRDPSVIFTIVNSTENRKKKLNKIQYRQMYSENTEVNNGNSNLNRIKRKSRQKLSK